MVETILTSSALDSSTQPTESTTAFCQSGVSIASSLAASIAMVTNFPPFDLSQQVRDYLTVLFTKLLSVIFEVPLEGKYWKVISLRKSIFRNIINGSCKIVMIWIPAPFMRESRTFVEKKRPASEFQCLLKRYFLTLSKHCYNKQMGFLCSLFGNNFVVVAWNPSSLIKQ